MELSSEKILSIPTPSATDYAFSTTSPAFLKCAFFAFRMRQVTTLYSGHIASESLTLQRSREAAKRVMMLSMISGKWNVLERMGGFGRGQSTVLTYLKNVFA